LRLKVAPPPEDGRANARVLELVGELFAIRARDVVIAAGESSRSKDVLLGDLDLPSAQARLAALLEGGRPDGSRTRRRLPEGGRGD
jgi:uncharacterized protein YggU (UPF0235/DUF167 family)